jgi:hypothetical protein
MRGYPMPATQPRTHRTFDCASGCGACMLTLRTPRRRTVSVAAALGARVWSKTVEVCCGCAAAVLSERA